MKAATNGRAAGRRDGRPDLATVGVGAGVIALAAAAWLAWVDASWAYVPISDSALYLEAALHLGRGDGLVTLVGYPIEATTDPLLRFSLHPPLAIVPFALAGLASGTDAIVVALGVALALYLGTVLLCFAVALRVAALPIAAVAAAAFALDGLVLADSAGVLTTAPYALAIAAAVLVFAEAWPPSDARLALAGALLAGAHLVRMSELPLVVALAAVLAFDRRPRSLAAFLGTYAVGVLATAPLVPPSPAQAALLLAGTPGFEGFGPAQLDAPPLLEAIATRAPAIAQKAAGNLIYNLRLLPTEGNAYLLVGGLTATVLGAVRGDRRLAALGLAFAATVVFTSAFVVGARYTAHLLLPISVVAVVALARSVRRPMPLVMGVLLLGTALLASDLRSLYRAGDAARALADAYLVAAAAVRELSSPAETVISDTPSFTALYAERRSFAIPLRYADLERLERRIGGARLLILTRHALTPSLGYPDDRWREALERDEVAGFVLRRTIGSGDAEVRIYRRRP